MAIGLIGKKCGMTRIFDEATNASYPVSVIHVEPNHITQLKTAAQDGYDAIQITLGERKAKRVSKSLKGHYAKANVAAGRGMWEFRVDSPEALTVKQGEDAEAKPLEVGSEITVNLFKAGEKIDVTGKSKGKGFAGVVKRHNFATQDATHGNSLSHRASGSIGQNQTPGRVFKGKKMAGQMGNVRKTMQNLEIVRIDAEKNLILVKGGIPGAPGEDVMIRPAVKSK